MATRPFDVAQFLMDTGVRARTQEYVARGDTTPIRVDLDLTSECNYRCRHCGDLARNLLNRGGLPWGIIEPLLDDLAALKVEEVALIGGGEPTLSPHLAKTLRGLRARRIASGVVTNGSCLSDAALDAMATCCAWIRVSLDAASADTYVRVHKPPRDVTFDQVLLNLERMIARMASRVGVSFLITPLNIREVAEAAARVKSMGAAYIRIRPMQHPITGESLALPSRGDLNDELRQAMALADDAFEVSLGEMTDSAATGKNVVQEKRYSRCHAQAFGATIAGDGKVYVCSKWRGEPWACIGDLTCERLWDIWHGDRRRAVTGNLDPSRNCRHVYCHAHALNQCVQAIEGRPLAPGHAV